VAGVTYDTGALVAAERNDRRMWALHAALLAEEIVPSIPAPVLAEAWRGGSRQASLARLLAMCDVEPLTEAMARAVGELVGRTGHKDIIDVTVIEAARRRGDSIVTSDPHDLRQIAESIRARIVIEAI
jgi:hypothetical protein